MVKQQLPGSSPVSAQHQLQILPSGHMPRGSDLIGRDIQGHLGQVFIFDTTLEPSFKLMHTSSDVITNISKCSSL